MLCDSGKNERELPERGARTLKLRENPEQLIPLEIEEDYVSMSRMMLPLAFAVL